MAFMTAVTALVGAMGVLNLLLLFGVIKRIRELTDVVNAGPGGGGDGALAVGEPVGDFTTATVRGEPVGGASFDDEVLVGFFSTTCQPCKEMLPEFLRTASDWRGGRSRVLAVVVGEAAAPMIGQLDPVALVVAEDRDGPVGSALRVKAFPTVRVLARATAGAGLVVTRAGLPEPQPSAAA